jgi:hypothetical protein
VSYIVRGVELDQTRLIARAIRMTSTIRKNIRPSMLRKVVGRLVPTSNPFFGSLSAALDKLESVAPAEEEDEEEAAGSGDNAATVPNGSMDVDAAAATTEEREAVAAPTAVTPEVEVYLFNLVLTGLLRHNAKADAVACASTMMARVMTFNRRTLDLLTSKVPATPTLTLKRTSSLIQTRSSLSRPRSLALCPTHHSNRPDTHRSPPPSILHMVVLLLLQSVLRESGR